MMPDEEATTPTERFPGFKAAPDPPSRPPVVLPAAGRETPTLFPREAMRPIVWHFTLVAQVAADV